MRMSRTSAIALSGTALAAAAAVAVVPNDDAARCRREQFAYGRIGGGTPRGSSCSSKPA